MNRKTLERVAKFKREMQRMVDKNGSGCTSITISSPFFNSGEEMVIAERKEARADTKEACANINQQPQGGRSTAPNAAQFSR